MSQVVLQFDREPEPTIVHMGDWALPEAHIAFPSHRYKTAGPGQMSLITVGSWYIEAEMCEAFGGQLPDQKTAGKASRRTKRSR